MRPDEFRRGVGEPRLPDAENQWTAIRARLAGERAGRHRGSLRTARVPLPFAAAAALAAVLVGIVAGVYRQFAAPERWMAVGPAPAAALDTAWIETGSAAMRVAVGRIGHVTLAPGAKARVVRGAWNEHRLALARGSIEAVIAAPPRLFFVETPTVLATDLGCAYRLEVGDDGAAALSVSVGWVELAHDGVRSVVPAGLTALVAADGTPGVPHDAALPAEARDAIGRLASGRHDRRADLDLVLATLDSADVHAPWNIRNQTSGITLWHLLQRVDAAERPRVAAALAQRAERPAGVTREGILALDRQMLDRWRRALHPMWGEEPGPLWVVAAQRIWLWVMD